MTSDQPYHLLKQPRKSDESYRMRNNMSLRFRLRLGTQSR